MKKHFSHGDYLALDRKNRLRAIQSDVLALGAPIVEAFGRADDVKRARMNAKVRRSEFSSEYLIHERGFARLAPDAKSSGPIGVALALLLDFYDSPQLIELIGVITEIERARALEEKAGDGSDHT